jgi:hypothetical protein
MTAHRTLAAVRPLPIGSSSGAWKYASAAAHRAGGRPTGEIT